MRYRAPRETLLHRMHSNRSYNSQFTTDSSFCGDRIYGKFENAHQCTTRVYISSETFSRFLTRTPITAQTEIVMQRGCAIHHSYTARISYRFLILRL